MDELEQCRRTIEHLREENAILRQAAAAFGALAERQSAMLQRERRAESNARPERRDEAVQDAYPN